MNIHKPSRATSKAGKISDEYRAQITDGTLAPGAQLPTEHQIAEDWHVSRTTAREGLRILAVEGLVEAKAPHGWFVRSRNRIEFRPQADSAPRRRVPAVRDRFLEAFSAQGRTPSQTIEVMIAEPDTDIRKRLALPDGELVAIRRRVQYLDGDPFYGNDSYYPLKIVEGSEILNPTDIARGANTVLSEIGHKQVRGVDEIHTRMPTPDEINRLEIPPGTPVVINLLTGFDEENRAVQVVRNTLPGDRHVIIFEREMNVR